MELYDKEVENLTALLADVPAKHWGSDELSSPSFAWRSFQREQLILRSDMAFELGGGEREAVSGICFTWKETVVPESGVCVFGPDLPEIDRDCSYARMTLIRLRQEFGVKEEQALYQILRKIEYVRYHMYPEGYMMRISARREREPVRIAREALAGGLMFAKVGACFNRAYEAQEAVEAVKTIFITDPGADYQGLKALAHRCQGITDSLNHMYENLTMDCASCGQREICSEVEGLRELHVRLQSGSGMK